MAIDNNNFVQSTIPRFDGHYDHGSMLVENHLRSKKYWSLVESEIPSLVVGVQPTQKGNTRLLRKQTKEFDEAKISRVYKGEKNSIASFSKEFEVLEMKDGEIVYEYFSWTLSIANKMKAHGE
ncbi:hypothetical protein CR513_60859, partial [Mucuna pruriens]